VAQYVVFKEGMIRFQLELVFVTDLISTAWTSRTRLEFGLWATRILKLRCNQSLNKNKKKFFPTILSDFKYLSFCFNPLILADFKNHEAH
jgi:hypothetical protein